MSFDYADALGDGVKIFSDHHPCQRGSGVCLLLGKFEGRLKTTVIAKASFIEESDHFTCVKEYSDDEVTTSSLHDLSVGGQTLASSTSLSLYVEDRSQSIFIPAWTLV